MRLDATATSPQSRTYRAGWGWLLLSTVSRFYLVLVGALAACALLPMLFGLTGAVVQSGSMEPHIHQGDVVLSRALSPTAPTPLGRVVTFKAPLGSARQGDVLHRLVAIKSNGSLVTKGDANARADTAPLARNDIISTACLLIPWVGLPSFWVTNGAFLPLGIWIVLTVVAVAVAALDSANQPPAPPKEPGPPADSGHGPEGLGDTQTHSATGTTGKPATSTPSVAHRSRRGRTPHLTIAAAMISMAALTMAPLGSAEAAFSATTGAGSNSWTAARSATHLSFTTSPSNSTGGIPFGTQPVVAVQDAAGATVGVSSTQVTLNIVTPAGATLACTRNPTNASAGVATFAGCRIDKSGTYTLTASSNGLTSALSASFTIAVGPAVQLGFTRVPASTAVNTSFSAQPRVAIQDAGGNTRTSSTGSVTLAITPPAGGAALTNCSANPRSTSSGVASFSSCRINTAGTYTLSATAAGLTAAVSTSFTIYGQASKLAFTMSPSSSTASTPFSTQPVVTIQDASGNIVPSSTASVTLSITAPAGGAILTCLSSALNATSGAASFSSCRIDRTGTYTLTATSVSLATAASTSFAITPASATKLGFTSSPSTTTSGTSFSTQPVIAIQDAAGNTTAGTNPVTLTITTPAGGTLTCSANPVSAVSGIATFAGCSITKTGTYTLTAAASGLASSVSSSFTITPGAAAQLAFSTTPAVSAAGAVFGTQPVVTIEDGSGNTVTSSSASVTLTLTTPAGATLSCPVNPRAGVAGVVAFSGCSINKAGSYTLTAAASGLTAAVSASVTITAPATKLAFTRNPSSSGVNQVLNTQPVVTIQDASGNTVASSTAAVTLSVTSGGPTLTCTANPVTATAGVATFAGCRLDATGTYTMTATSSGLTSAVSTVITIT